MMKSTRYVGLDVHGISGGAVDIVTRRREDPLPGPLAARGGALSVDGVWERHGSSAGGEIFGVLSAYSDEVGTQRGLDAGGDHGHAILASLPVVHGELVAVEVQILGAKLRALEHAQARPIQQAGHEMGHVTHASEHGGHLVSRQDDRETSGTLGVNDLGQPVESPIQNVLIKKEQRRERLVLRGRCDMVIGGEAGKEGSDLRLAYLVGVAFAVE